MEAQQQEEVERDSRGRVIQCHYLPTTDEIAAECERIQATWSPRDRRNRHYMARYRVEVQVVNLEPPLSTE